MFRLDWKLWRWHSLDEPQEGAFPLITVADGKRYQLYSDGTFAEVEKSAPEAQAMLPGQERVQLSIR
jgi:hypothetical protein